MEKINVPKYNNGPMKYNEFIIMIVHHSMLKEDNFNLYKNGIAYSILIHSDIMLIIKEHLPLYIQSLLCAILSIFFFIRML